MDTDLKVSLEGKHKTFQRLADSVNSSGLLRESLEVAMRNRGIDPQDLEEAVQTVESSDSHSLEDVIDNVSTTREFIAHAENAIQQHD